MNGSASRIAAMAVKYGLSISGHPRQRRRLPVSLERQRLESDIRICFRHRLTINRTTTYGGLYATNRGKSTDIVGQARPRCRRSGGACGISAGSDGAVYAFACPKGTGTPIYIYNFR